MDTSKFFSYPNAEQPPVREEAVLLPGLDEHDWARLLAHAVQRRFSAGALVIAAGDHDSAIYIIGDGLLEVLRPDRQQTIIVGPGNVIGEIAFFDGQPRSADVRAGSDCTLFSISRENFDVLSAHEPLLARRLVFDLARILATRLRRVQSGVGH